MAPQPPMHECMYAHTSIAQISCVSYQWGVKGVKEQEEEEEEVA